MFVCLSFVWVFLLFVWGLDYFVVVGFFFPPIGGELNISVIKLYLKTPFFPTLFTQYLDLILFSEISMVGFEKCSVFYIENDRG